VTKIATAILFPLLLTALLSSDPLGAQEPPTQEDLESAISNYSDWLLTDHDYFGWRFSGLDLINRENASQLRPVCMYQAGDTLPFQTNPIAYGGVLYITTALATVALDASTCRVLWRHDWEPKAKESWPQQRGAALKDGKVIRGTNDGYLLALDAATGELLWERKIADSAGGESLSMPPMIFEDMIFIGPAGSENAIRGWIGAFRLSDGEPIWRFNTFPKEDDPAAETWEMAADTIIGGGAIWTSLALDPAKGLLFVPVSNPAPDLHGEVRGGDNLYTNSLVVLDVRTGELNWHHQLVSHDTHDWDLTQVKPLISVETADGPTALVVTVGKEGILRALNRSSQEVLYEVPVTTIQNHHATVNAEAVHVCPGQLGGVQWN
jgi:alcohol dehydrogenase (cytochrome c)